MQKKTVILRNIITIYNNGINLKILKMRYLFEKKSFVRNDLIQLFNN